MKTLRLVLLFALPSAASAATVAVLPVTPYRSLDDSPWKEAVQAGDALKFRFGDCNEHADTLPSGFGVHDDFEDRDCISSWLRLQSGEILRGASVDADDRYLDGFGQNGYSLSRGINPESQQLEIALEFAPTSSGYLPQWFGFAVTSLDISSATINILGAGNTFIASFNFNTWFETNLFASSVSDDRFIGFITDAPVSRVIITSSVIDHFQYGYGTPVPEPAAPALAATACLLFLRRKRTK